MTPILTVPRSTNLPVEWSFADIQAHLGGVPLERIRSFPPAGLATVADVEAINESKTGLCELVDGILLEKTMGWYESAIALWIGTFLNNYLLQNPIGKALGEAGTLEILPNLVRVPDVCFISWDRFPEGRLPREPIPSLAPDLAVEVISAGNTPREMEQKREHYFQAGVRLVWYVDPVSRTATVYTSLEDPGTQHALDEPLLGGDVLPGFELSLARVFEEADREAGQ